MNEVTPELIAQIASRLYNRSAADGSPSAPGEVENVASPPAIPAATIPAVQVPQASIPHSPTGFHFPTTPAVAPSYPQATRVEAVQQFTPLHHVPTPHTQAPSSLPNVPAVTKEDGLKAFVQNIKQPGLAPRDRSCQQDLDQGLFHRLLTKNAIPNGSSRPFDVNTIRRDFPILNQKIHGKPLVWLDNAATTQKPQSVIDALSYYYAHDNSNIHRAAHSLAARSTDAYEQARQKIQQFIHANSTNEIVLVRGTTEGINLIAYTYGKKFLQPGDEIVLTTLEHHANIVPWQIIAEERKAGLRVVPINDRGEIMLEHYNSLLNPRTKIVAFTHASNSLGTILPIAEMTQMAKRYGAKVLIDGAQSVAHIPVNVQELGCDFFVFSGHKIFGPTGIGAVYAKEELLELMPPWQGGGNMIRNVTFEETTYGPPPAKFEAGTPNIADTVGLGAALDYVNRLGLTNIAKYEHELLGYATEQLSRIDGLRLLGTAREKVGVLSFVLPNRRTEDVGRMLDLEGIAVRSGHHCAQPSLRRFGLESTVRPSLSFYNTHAEIDHLAAAIRRIQSN